MQTLDWYYRRLKAMSPGEIAWRMRSSLRDRADWFLVGRPRQLRNPTVFFNRDGRDEGLRSQVSGMVGGAESN